MGRLLVLGAAAVQADAVRIAQAMGHEVHVCAANTGPGSAVADKFAPFSFTDLDRLTQYVHDQQIDAVYSVGSDIAMPVVGAVSEELDLPYLTGAEVARHCNDKTAMRGLLAAAEFVGNPWFHRVGPGDQLPSVTGEAFVKPADSQGQRGVRRVENSTDLADAVADAQAISRTGAAVVEQFLDGPELSVNLYLADGEPVFQAVSDRHVWPDYIGLVKGHTMPAGTVTPDVAAAAATISADAARILGITDGPAYAQVKATSQGPKIVEISPRLDGCHVWKLIDECYGVNLIETAWQHLLTGSMPPITPKPVGHSTSIDFVCSPPGIPAAYSPDVQHRYYADGDEIRPVNGRFEKIGYNITRQG